MKQNLENLSTLDQLQLIGCLIAGFVILFLVLYGVREAIELATNWFMNDKPRDPQFKDKYDGR